MKFEGIAAVVTGGASGLGAATASLLAARGAKVTIIDLNADLGNAKAKEIDPVTSPGIRIRRAQNRVYSFRSRTSNSRAATF